MKKAIRISKIASAIFCLTSLSITLPAQSTYYNAGGAQYVSLAGDTFKPDLHYTPGATSTYTNPTAGLDILSTDDDVIFRSERNALVSLGTFGYDIPAANGYYNVKLYFAEIYYGAPGGNNNSPPHTGKRVFDVSIEGVLKLDNYDIVADVGSVTAAIKEYDSIAVIDGILDIDLTGVVNKPKISALSFEFIASLPGDSSNTPPAFTLSGNVNVNEDFAGTQTITVTPDPVPSAEAGQTVTYSLFPASASFANVSINSTTGTVSITKVNNGNGSQPFTITANDGQPSNNTATQNFTLTVNAVNDPPLFELSGNVSVTKNFATTQQVDVTPGAIPTDETGQTAVYSLTPPSVAFANVSINSSTGQVSISSVADAVGSQLFTVTANDGQALNNTATQTFTLAVNDSSSGNPTPNALCLNCGGSQYISTSGDTFKLDAFYTAGTANYTNNFIPDIFNTTDDAIFKTERNAMSFGYNIPVANGTYTVKLYFAEIYYGATGGTNANPPHNGKRVFNVAIEGNTVLSNYDVYAEAGSETAVVKTFSDITVSNDTLDIDFTSVVNKAKISGICIIPDGDTSIANTPPAFTTSGNINVDEDFAGTQTVTVTSDPVPPAEAGQTVSYSLSPPSVGFANVSINNSTGNVTITSVLNGNGSQVFTITANDGQANNNIATQNFTLTVNAFNDAPSFTLNKSSVAATKNFLTTEQVNVIPGITPSDEAAQSVTYSLAPPSVAFANVSINSSTGQVSITSVANGIGFQLFTITANDGQAGNNTATQNFTLTVNDAGNQDAIHINCGGPQYITAANDTFIADSYFSAGSTSTNNVIPDILNTGDDALFRSERFASSFNYNIPVENGTYSVELHFAEIFFGATGGNNTPPFNGKRVFDVSIEGAIVLDNYDIYTAAGGAERAITEQIDDVTVSDGNITIDFAASVNNAKISAISIISDGVADLPPTVSITNPSDGASFVEGATIQINANATDDVGITNVEFYEGVNLIGADNSTPYSFNWTNAAEGNYSLTAKAFDTQGASTISDAVNISVTAPSGDLNALLVAGAIPLNNGDMGVVSRLQALGFTVTTVLAASSTAADASGKDLVLISSTVMSADVGNKFANVLVPVICWEQGLFDDLGMTSSASGNSGSTGTGATQLNIIGAGHPLAAGLSNGLTSVYASAQTATWGKPNANSVTIATISGSATQMGIFGYESGAQMVNGIAAARRVGFFIHDAGAAFLTAEGTALLDAAITWAANSIPPPANTPPAVSITSPLNGASFNAPANITIEANASDPDAGGSISKVEFYEGATLLNTDLSNPFSYNWNNVPAGNYTITAKAFDNLNASTASAAVSITVNSASNNPPVVSLVTPTDGAAFNAPASIALAANAFDPDLEGSISKVEFYEGANLLNTDFSSPYTFDWLNVAAGNYTISAKAFDNLNTSTTSAAVNITVNPGANNPPVVSISSPLNGSTFLAPASITISANASDPDAGGSISKVEFYEGLNLLNADLSAPYSFDWANVAAGSYAVTAKAFDNLNATTTSSVVNITVNNPSAQGTILFITGNLTLNNGDNAIKTRLESLGYAVEVKLASASATADATGKALIIISATITSGHVGSKFTNVAVPVINCEQALFDDLKMASSASGNTGTFSGQTQLNITGAGHPLAAGLPNGLATVCTSGQKFSWAVPGANAVTVATLSSNAANALIFGYESGTAMVGLNAPARRLGFFFENSTASFLNANGLALFDAAINWALDAATPNNPPTVSIANPSNGASFIAPANITINADAIDPDSGGSITQVEFYEGANLLGTDLSSPFSYEWINAPAGSYSLTAKAFDNLNASATSAAVNITVNSPGNNPPSVSLISPADGSAFIAPASVTIAANASDPDLGGSISKVEFYEGANLLNTDFTAPYSFDWINVAAGNYTLMAKAFDNLNATASSAAVSITVNNPSTLGTILFAVGNLTLNNGDLAVKTRLETLGYSVEVKQGTSTATSDAFGKKLIVISSTLSSWEVGNKFTNVDVPVLNYEQALFDDLKMVSTGSANAGTLNGQSQVNIIGAGHPLAAGLPNGAAIVCLSNQKFSWGTPNANALNIATATGNPSQSLIFGYESGASMEGLSAPARRVGFFLENATAAFLSANGTALFDAAVEWAVGTPSPNTPPAVSITNPSGGANFTAPAAITINVTAADADFGGSISKVEFYEGANLLNTDLTGPFSFDWINVPAGNYALTAKAFDNLNASATSAAVNITVNQPLNNPPVVSLVTPTNGAAYNAPANISLAANAFDPDLGGSISKVEFYEGANLLNADLTAPYTFDWTSVAVGNYSLTAKAYDDQNASTTSAAVNVTVNQAPNNPPTVNIASPVNGTAFIAPASVTITANASDPDFGGSVSKVEFYEGLNLLATDLSGPFTFNWTNVPAGSYSLTAKAFDDLNTVSTSPAVNITVNTPNTPPIVSITSPANGAAFSAPAGITINANASDPDAGGSISKVEFYQGATLLHTDLSSPFSFAWTNVPIGNYTLTAKAYDNLNASTTSATVNVTVNPNNPPIVSITNPANGSAYLPPATFAIAVSATDPDAGGSIAKVEFYQGNILMGTDFTSPYSLSLSGVPAGNYFFTAKAYDNLNATASAFVNISVNATANQPPSVIITAPTNGSDFLTPTNVTVTAVASDPSPEGSISKVEFFQGSIKIGTVTTSPYSFTWNNVPAGSYQLTAKAFDNLNASAISAPVNITVTDPPSFTALLVVGNVTLNNGDAAVKNKLENMGYVVTVVSDAESSAALAEGKTMVLISSTVIASNVNTKFTNANVPVITWESGLLDDLKLTGSASTEFGSAYNQTQINITGAGHPLAGGLSNGLTQVFNSAQTMTWGKPNGNAAAIAAIADDPTRICLFGYETGSLMFGINAPARRIGLFMADNGSASFSGNGTLLLEAAINWAAGTGSKREEATVSSTTQKDKIQAFVYPNPNNGNFNLKIENSGDGKLSVRIFNQLGQAIVTDERSGNAAYDEKFDLSSMPSGLYFIQIQAGGERLSRSVFINGR